MQFVLPAKVSEPAEKLCSESIQPYLGSVLEELMKPISLGFLEGRQLMETMMDQVCRNALECEADEQIKKVSSSRVPDRSRNVLLLSESRIMGLYRFLVFLVGSEQHVKTKPGELLPEDRLAGGRAAPAEGEIWLLQRQRDDTERSDRLAAGQLVMSNDNG